MHAEVRPFPSELTTPPVTKMCLVMPLFYSRGKWGPTRSFELERLNRGIAGMQRLIARIDE